MALYELSDKQISELGSFLGRVDVKGTEAVQFVNILIALRNPVIPKVEEPVTKGKEPEKVK